MTQPVITLCTLFDIKFAIQGITMIEERRVKKMEEIDPQFWIDLPNKRTKGSTRSDQ